ASVPKLGTTDQATYFSACSRTKKGTRTSWTLSFIPSRKWALPTTSRSSCTVKNRTVEKFREKYGTKDVKKYYSKFDVAVVAELGRTGMPLSVDLPLAHT